MITTFRTRLHGRTIELPWELGLPEGHVVEVTIKTCPEVESPPEPPPPWWLERFEVNPAVVPGKFVIKGTEVRADALVSLVEEGQSDEDLLRAHPALTPQDVQAVREYAKVPLGLSRSCGAWAEDAEDLARFSHGLRTSAWPLHRGPTSPTRQRVHFSGGSSGHARAGAAGS